MSDFLTLSKPRITALVALTTMLGWKLGGGAMDSRLVWLLLGVSLASAACGALNQWLESDVDALMARTKDRPLPAGRLSPETALGFGLALAAAGLAVLMLRAGLRPTALTALTLLLYVCAYTPLKRLTPHSTWVGAIAGATPPLIGWCAATGRVSPEGLALFGIQFLWQIPHFLALFWMRRDEYARAGFKVMPVVDETGGATACQIAIHSFALVPASLVPMLFGLADASYGWAALALGSAFLVLGMRTSWTLAQADARRLFFASLVYLPALFGMLALGGA